MGTYHYTQPEFDGFNCSHDYLYHYTDEEGYNGILSDLSIWPSTVDGIKNTHYGRGIYLTPIHPAEIPILGVPDFLTRVFGDVTTHSVSRTKYYFCLRVDPNWYTMAARDPEYGYWIKDIWVVPGEEPTDISEVLVEHGQTVIWQEVDGLEDTDTPERDYAYRLTHPHVERPQARMTWDPPPYVFIGGHTVRRPEGWYEDAPEWWVGPGQNHY